MSGHADVLRQLWPWDLPADGTDLDTDFEVEGSYLDSVAAAGEALLPEMFEDTVGANLSSFERIYGIVPDPSATDDARRKMLVARAQLRAGIDRAFYIALAAAYGWTISITEGPHMFRAGYSVAGDPVYSMALMWSWTVTVHAFLAGHGKAGDLVYQAGVELGDLESLITDLSPAWTSVSFVYGG